MSKNYNFTHQKKKKKGKGKGGNGGNNGEAKVPYNSNQRDGNFPFDTVHGAKMKEVEYKVPASQKRKDMRNKFQGVRGPNGEVVVEGDRSKFIKMLVKEKEKELVERLGLTERDLEGMREGYVPNGFNVHHKLPIHGGGTNDFKNLILTPLYPHDQWHNDILNPQIANMGEGHSRTINLPWSDDMIYDPKTYGFSKDKQPVKPNYTSKVNPANYPNLYLPEHISVEKRAKDMVSHYAEMDAKKAERDKARAKDEKGQANRKPTASYAPPPAEKQVSSNIKMLMKKTRQR